MLIFVYLISLIGIFIFCIKFGVALIQISISLLKILCSFLTLLVDLAIQGTKGFFDLFSFLMIKTTDCAIGMNSNSLPNFEDVQRERIERERERERNIQNEDE